jgi:hypothetical protein
MAFAFNPVKIFFKSLGLAVVASAISFFAGNFLGIVVLGLYGMFKHVTPDFSLAYRRGGVPIAISVFFVAFVVVFANDVRRAMKGG